MANESAQLGGISVKWDENFPYECKFAMLQPSWSAQMFCMTVWFTEMHIIIYALAPVILTVIPVKQDEFLPIWNKVDIYPN